MHLKKSPAAVDIIYGSLREGRLIIPKGIWKDLLENVDNRDDVARNGYPWSRDGIFFGFFSDQVWTSSMAKTPNLVFSNQACLVQNPITVKIFDLPILFDPISYVAEMVFFKKKPHFRAFQR